MTSTVTYLFIIFFFNTFDRKKNDKKVSSRKSFDWKFYDHETLFGSYLGYAKSIENSTYDFKRNRIKNIHHQVFQIKLLK